MYNTGGYDSLETLRLLDGVFDLYMPDLKFMDGEVSQRSAGPETILSGRGRRSGRCTGRWVICVVDLAPLRSGGSW